MAKRCECGSFMFETEVKNTSCSQVSFSTTIFLCKSKKCGKIIYQEASCIDKDLDLNEIEITPIEIKNRFQDKIKNHHF